jgi:hypothetical protein
VADNRNPYAPPTAYVADKADIPPSDSSEEFIPNGRSVSAGRGSGWIGDAWRLFRARPGKWLLTFVIVILLAGAASWIPVVSLLNSLLWPFIGAGIVAAADLQRRTGAFDLDTLFAGLRKPAPLLIIGGVFLLTFIPSYVAMAALVGVRAANQAMLNLGGPLDPETALSSEYWLAILISLAIVLPISAATFFAAPLILFHDLPAGTAMKMSLIASIKNILPGLVFSLCAFLFVLVSIIPIGLGLLVSIPVLMITAYTMYRDIFIQQV